MHSNASETSHWRASIAENGFANAYANAVGNNHASSCGWYTMQDLNMSLPNGQTIPESFRDTQLALAKNFGTAVTLVHVSFAVCLFFDLFVTINILCYRAIPVTMFFLLYVLQPIVCVAFIAMEVGIVGGFLFLTVYGIYDMRRTSSSQT